jgi:hypothetical protein
MRRAAIIVVGIFGVFAAAVFAFYAATPWIDLAQPVTHSRFGDCLLYSVLTIAALSVSGGLFKRKVWAWCIALIVSLLVLTLACWLLYKAAHPENPIQGSEMGDAFGSCVILGGPALISVSALMLTSVRDWFFKRAE